MEVELYNLKISRSGDCIEKVKSGRVRTQAFNPEQLIYHVLPLRYSHERNKQQCQEVHRDMNWLVT